MGTEFETEITLAGPWRAPAQMLADQSYDGHASVHDEAAAGTLGLAGAPIEGPTHFSQFDPLAVRIWGQRWFEAGCISSHFQTMVVEGEQVQASMVVDGLGDAARIAAVKTDGTPVLEGSASVGPAHPESALDARRARQRPPSELFVIDQLEIGMRTSGGTVSITHEDRNGSLYPFSLAEKVERITEPHPWYTPDGGASSPWGRAIVPMEMISVLAHKSGGGWPVRTPSLGLFLDLEVRMLDGPVFVDQPYAIEREVIALGESRRTESYWTRTTVADVDRDAVVAEVILHSGVFKESYAGYPKDRL